MSLSISAKDIQAAGGLAKFVSRFERAKHTCTPEEWISDKLNPKAVRRLNKKVANIAGTPKQVALPVPTESEEQISLITWWDAEGGHALCKCERDLLFHIPNGGKRSESEAARFQREGVRPGVPDLCLAVARNGYHGLYIEMKRSKRSESKISEYQKAMIERLKQGGYAVTVCYGAEEAKQALLEYTGGQ